MPLEVARAPLEVAPHPRAAGLKPRDDGLMGGDTGDHGPAPAWKGLAAALRATRAEPKGFDAASPPLGLASTGRDARDQGPPAARQARAAAPDAARPTPRPLGAATTPFAPAPAHLKRASKAIGLALKSLGMACQTTRLFGIGGCPDSLATSQASCEQPAGSMGLGLKNLRSTTPGMTRCPRAFHRRNDMRRCRLGGYHRGYGRFREQPGRFHVGQGIDHRWPGDFDRCG